MELHLGKKGNIYVRSMKDQTINITVDADLAKAFMSAGIEDREDMSIAIRQFLRNRMYGEKNALMMLMNDMSDQAISNGMTKETLASLLGDEYV